MTLTPTATVAGSKAGFSKSRDREPPSGPSFIRLRARLWPHLHSVGWLASNAGESGSSPASERVAGMSNVVIVGAVVFTRSQPAGHHDCCST